MKKLKIFPLVILLLLIQCISTSGGVYWGKTLNRVPGNKHIRLVGIIMPSVLQIGYKLSKTDDSTAITAKAASNRILGRNICLGDTFRLSVAKEKNVKFTWYTKDGIISHDTMFFVSPTKAATYYYYLNHKDTLSGASVTDTFILWVTLLSSQPLLPGVTVCLGQSVKIGRYNLPGYYYSWTSKPAGFISNNSMESIKPNITTTYYIYEKDMHNCYRKDSVTITVLPLPNAKWRMDKIGRVFNFHALDSSLHYESYIWTIDDNHKDLGHFVEHRYYQNGIYKVSLIVNGNNGCANEFDSIIGITAYPFDSIAFYPNPFSTHLSAEYWISQNKNINIALYDIIGRQIGLYPQGFKSPGHYKVEIDAESLNLAPGNYLMEFMEDDRLLSKVLLKLK